jgi:hypothetical protein
MKKIPKVTYKTPAELQEEIDRRETALQLLSDGQIRDKVKAEVVRLRSYAEMKRVFGA